jgi:hypothetical protein
MVVQAVGCVDMDWIELSQGMDSGGLL